MLGLFFNKEKQKFKRISKVAEKTFKTNKDLLKAFSKDKKSMKDILSILNKKENRESISCYDKTIPEIIYNHFEEEGFITEENKERYLSYKNFAENLFDRNIRFLEQRISRVNLIFTYKKEQEEELKKLKKKERKKKEERLEQLGRNLKRENMYMEDILELVNDKYMNGNIINTFFINFINHIGQIRRNSENYLKIFNKIISHPNFDNKLLEEFMLMQMSKKDGNNYMADIKIGDDLDLNLLKRYILEKKILKHYQVIGLASLPYISLWEYLIKNYFLTQHLLIDFLGIIFKYKKPEEKTMILNFINTKLGYIYKNPEIKYMIQRYIDEK